MAVPIDPADVPVIDVASWAATPCRSRASSVPAWYASPGRPPAPSSSEHRVHAVGAGASAGGSPSLRVVVLIQPVVRGGPRCGPIGRTVGANGPEAGAACGHAAIAWTSAT